MTGTITAATRLPDSFRRAREAGADADAEKLRADWLAQDESVKPKSFWRETGKRFLENKTGMAGAIVILLLILAAIFAPLIAPYDPLIGNPTDRLKPILSSGHLLGTDEQGRDMLSRILYGGRLTLIAAFVPAAVATVIGTAIGVMAAMTGGIVNTALMRSMDMLYAFPAVLLAIAVGASLGAGLANTLIAVTIVSIPPVSRVAESSTRRVITKEFVEAAKLSGAGRLRVARTQILPNVFNDVVVYASSLVGVSMLIAASLSFLGLGSLPPAPEWGYMLNSLRGSLVVAPVTVMIPGFFIFLTSVSFNLASDALREATDSRL